MADLPHLRALTLDNPDWHMMPELHAARLPHLERLVLDKEWNDDLPEWGTRFPNLRSLTLAHDNTYPNEQCGRFADLPHLRHLALYQRYQPLKRAGLKALAKAKHFRSLTVGPWPRGTIEAFAKLPHLERLEGSGEVVHGLEAMTRLRLLKLNGNVFPLAQARQVEELERRTADDDANPDDVVPWEQVKAEALARFAR